jgi:hypothetical protein
MDKLGHDEVSDLTFVMGHRTGHVMRSRLAYLAERAHRLFHYQIGFRLLPGLFPYRPDWNFFLAPASKRLAWSFQRIDHTNELHGPLAWAQSLDEPMFHHRTAFTAALNYLSVLFPTAKIRLVGTDFNGHGYFFDEEMKRRGHQWSDFSTALQVARKGHFATIPDAVPERPGTVFDVFPFIRDSIRARGGTVVCSNPESGTITHGLAQYEPIVPINSNPNPRSVDAERAVLEMTRE